MMTATWHMRRPSHLSAFSANGVIMGIWKVYHDENVLETINRIRKCHFQRENMTNEYKSIAIQNELLFRATNRLLMQLAFLLYSPK